METAINIVIPMAGRGSRFVDAGYDQPKPLIPIGGKPMIEWVIENIRPSRPHRFHFICLKEHLEKYPDLSSMLSKLCPDCTITEVVGVTEGAACTVLLAKEHFNDACPLMIANSDQIVELAIDDYLKAGDGSDIDGLVMTFWADDPKWSYCRMHADGTVAELVEKEVISNEATVGIYNFARGEDFVEAAERMIADNLRVKGEFYVAPVYNQLIENGAKVVVARTGKEYKGMYGLGIPEDFQFFRTTEIFLHNSKTSKAQLLRELTEAYVWAFNDRRMDGISNLLCKEIVLKDPNGLFEGSDRVLEVVQRMFSENGAELEFVARGIFVDAEREASMIEFDLILGGVLMQGFDLIRWKNNKMIRLDACLSIKD